MAEILDILQSTLDIVDKEATPLGLSVTWGKTKIQSLKDFEPNIPGFIVGCEKIKYRNMSTLVLIYLAPAVALLELTIA